MLSLRRRPTGIVRLPVAAAGDRSRTDASRVFGTTFTHWLLDAMMSWISSIGTSFFSLMVSACEWLRMAPMRTHRPSTGIAFEPKSAPRPRILLVSAPPFHSSFDWPLPRSLSIHGIRLPASGAPNCLVSSAVKPCWVASTWRSISRIADAGRGLIRHRRHPFDQVVLEQAAQAHQHARHRAIAADVVLHALAQRVLDDVQVDRIEHDHGVLFHAQRRRGVDPKTVPAGRAQFREHLAGVVAALARDDDLALFQFIDIARAFQRGFVFRHRRRGAARIRSGEEHRFDLGEIALFLHALHQHRTDNAAPTYQAH